MPLSDAQALDEIFELLQIAWNANEDSEDVPLLYEDTCQERPTSGAYALAGFYTVDVPRVTLSPHAQKRYTTVGIVTVQIRCPRGDGKTLAGQLAAVARDAFRGKRTANGVVFSRVRIKDAGIDGTYTLTNVIADFEFDSVGE